ncbi:MAG: hypothetical protein FJZ62_01985 [Chlamydiae bacterium]|nr:hypothetical protein [Chlamydiota bacterium]
MKKLFVVLFFIAIVLGIGGAVIYSKRVSLINQNLSSLFSVPVSLQKFDLTMRSIFIGGFVIGNPPRSVVPNAMMVNTIQINAPLWNFIQPNTEVDSIVVNGIDVDVEFYDPFYQKMNWDPILGSSTSKTAEPQKEAGSSVSVKKLTLQNLRITLRLPNQSPQVYTVRGPVVYQNLDSRKGGVTKVVADLIVRIVMQQVFSVQGLTKFGGSLFEGSVTPLKDLVPVPLP